MWGRPLACQSASHGCHSLFTLCAVPLPFWVCASWPLTGIWPLLRPCGIVPTWPTRESPKRLFLSGSCRLLAAVCCLSQGLSCMPSSLPSWRFSARFSFWCLPTFVYLWLWSKRSKIWITCTKAIQKGKRPKKETCYGRESSPRPTWWCCWRSWPAMVQHASWFSWWICAAHAAVTSFTGSEICILCWSRSILWSIPLCTPLGWLGSGWQYVTS